MNTTGMTRAYMARGMKNEDFLLHILEGLHREFEEEVTLFIHKDSYDISIREFKVNLSKEKTRELQKKDSYSLDKYILERLKEKGFEFCVERSQYVRYCYGIYI